MTDLKSELPPTLDIPASPEHLHQLRDLTRSTEALRNVVTLARRGGSKAVREAIVGGEKLIK